MQKPHFARCNFTLFSFIFQISKSSDTDLHTLVNIVLVIIPVFGILFIVCELCQRLTQKFDDFNDNLWECRWYLYPNRLQQMFLIFGANTQQSVNIRGYGNIMCTRETFKKVIDVQ